VRERDREKENDVSGGRNRLQKEKRGGEGEAMCSQAHFSSIVGFRVISIKELSHISLSLLRYCTEREDLSLILFLSFFSVVHACQLTALDPTRRTISVVFYLFLFDFPFLVTIS
jgi:hypothetical protein